MTYIKKGDQFWNDDHTEGYEITEDIHPMTPAMSSQFKPLGQAKECKPNYPMPEWLSAIVLRPSGVEAYNERNNITKG